MRLALQAAEEATALLEPNRARMVYLTGGKGGVGKSLLAANLALELAARGLRVLLVDLDLALSDLHVLLGLGAERSMESYFDGHSSLADCRLSAAPRVDLLAGGNGAAQLAALDEVQRAHFLDELEELGAAYDLVLCDGAAGAGADALAFAARADHVLLVTTPDPTAVTDAYGTLKALHAESERGQREVPTPELIVNLAGSIEEAHATARRLSAVAERFLARSPKLVGWLPRSAALARSVHEQRPIGGRREASSDAALPRSCLQTIAARLERACAGVLKSQGVGKDGR